MGILWGIIDNFDKPKITDLYTTGIQDEMLFNDTIICDMNALVINFWFYENKTNSFCSVLLVILSLDWPREVLRVISSLYKNISPWFLHEFIELKNVIFFLI